MTQSEDKIIIAKVGAPHGVKGWVKLNSFTTDPSKVFDYLPWQIKHAKAWQSIDIADYKVSAKNIVIRFTDCDDRDKAQSYTNLELAIDKSQLPKAAEGEYYWHDLEGLTVTNLQDQLLGKVSHLLATGANDVMVVAGQKRHLIPFIKDQVIKNIDLATQAMVVDWDADF